MSVQPWLRSIGLAGCCQYFVISAEARERWGNLDELSTLASLEIDQLHNVLDELLPESRADTKRTLAKAIISKLQRPASPRSSTSGTPQTLADTDLTDCSPEDVVRRSRVALQMGRQARAEAFAREDKQGRREGHRKPVEVDNPDRGPLRAAWQASVSDKAGRAVRRAADGGDGEPYDEGRITWGGRWMSTGINGVVVGRADKHLAGRIPAGNKMGSTSGLHFDHQDLGRSVTPPLRGHPPPVMARAGPPLYRSGDLGAPPSPPGRAELARVSIGGAPELEAAWSASVACRHHKDIAMHHCAADAASSSVVRTTRDLRSSKPSTQQRQGQRQGPAGRRKVASQSRGQLGASIRRNEEWAAEHTEVALF